MIYDYMTELSRLLYVNILAYDYSGYGIGMHQKDNKENVAEPSEENCYADIEAAFDYLTNVEFVGPQQIVLYGRSVGSGPSCYLAEKISGEMGTGLAGMILHSPFLSVCRVVLDVGVENAFDVFPNISRIRQVTCPVFIIHGTKDAVVPFNHGRCLYEALPEKARYNSPFWAENMGHNNIESDMASLFIKKLRKFFLSLKCQNPDIIDEVEVTRKRLWTPVQISFKESKEEESTRLLPKSKLVRNKSPQSVLERLPSDIKNTVNIESRVSLFETQEIECEVIEHRSQ